MKRYIVFLSILIVVVFFKDCFSNEISFSTSFSASNPVGNRSDFWQKRSFKGVVRYDFRYLFSNELEIGIYSSYSRWIPNEDKFIQEDTKNGYDWDPETVLGSLSIFEIVPYLRYRRCLDQDDGLFLFGQFGFGLFSRNVVKLPWDAQENPLTINDGISPNGKSTNSLGISFGAGVTLRPSKNFSIDVYPLYHLIFTDDKPDSYYSICFSGFSGVSQIQMKDISDNSIGNLIETNIGFMLPLGGLNDKYSSDASIMGGFYYEAFFENLFVGGYASYNRLKLNSIRSKLVEEASRICGTESFSVSDFTWIEKGSFQLIEFVPSLRYYFKQQNSQSSNSAYFGQFGFGLFHKFSDFTIEGSYTSTEFGKVDVGYEEEEFIEPGFSVGAGYTFMNTKGIHFNVLSLHRIIFSDDPFIFYSIGLGLCYGI